MKRNFHDAVSWVVVERLLFRVPTQPRKPSHKDREFFLFREQVISDPPCGHGWGEGHRGRWAPWGLWASCWLCPLVQLTLSNAPVPSPSGWCWAHSS